MKLKAALRKVKTGERIKSKRVGMYEQDAATLLHWLVIDPTADTQRMRVFSEMLEADDWEVEETEAEDD